MSYKRRTSGSPQNTDAATLGTLVDNLSRKLNVAGTDLADRSITGLVISSESLDPTKRANLTAHESNVDALLTEILDGQGIAFESLTEAQKDAGRLTLMAAGDPKAYFDAALSIEEMKSSDYATVITPVMSGAHGAIDYREEFSFHGMGLESFNESEIKQHLGFSTIFNIQTARQGDGAEALYPTVVITPDQAGVEVVCPRLTVFNEVRYASAGKPVDWQRSNVIDALTDPAILSDNSIEAVPVLVTGGGVDDNSGHFTTNIGTVNVTVNGVPVPTRPLVFGDFNLLDLTQNDGLRATGLFDSTDDLSPRLGLKNLYLALTDDTLVAVTDYVKVNVSRLPRAYFVKSTEGGAREMVLTFNTDDIIMTADTLAVDGNPPAALVDLFAGAGGVKKIRFSVRVTGSVDLEEGNMNVALASISIKDYYNADGQSRKGVAAADKDVDDFITALDVDSFDLEACRTNYNRRNRGLLVDTREVRERYTIGLLAPISTPRPVTNTESGTEIANVITTARIRNDNNAFTRLFNYADTLREYVSAINGNMAPPVIEGIGRYLVRPWFDEINADVSEVTNSIKSHEKFEDISATLVNAVRALAYRAAMESRYLAALDATSGGVKSTPQLTIVTDPETARYLVIQGDTRLGGVVFETKVAIAHDQRVRGKIIVVFTRAETQGTPDPLSFGFHAWIPELASTVQVSRNGATTREAMVQARSLHVNTCPIMGIVNVSGLVEAMTELTPQPWLREE